MYTFQEIWGNERLLLHLKNAVKGGRLSHAYMLIGGKGAGKKMIADTFAKYVLCEERGDEPCCRCKSCRVFDSGNHPDVIYVSGEKKSLGVDEIRMQILETVDLKPYHYDKKLYIIENAHTMTAQAQNALLKTLEEPPEYVIFLLLAERTELFLPTILSRVVRLKLSTLSEKEVKEYLLKKGLTTEDKADFYAAYSQGRIGQVSELLEDEAFSSMREDVIDKISRLPQMTTAEAVFLAKAWEAYKNDHRFLDIIELWYRDMLVVKELKNSEHIIEKDKAELLYAAPAEPLEILASKAASVAAAKERLAQNGNFRLTVEVMLMELKETGNV